MKKILVAYDGSEQSEHALATAAELARNGTEIVVLSVAEPLTAVAFDTIPNPFSEEEQVTRLQEATTRLTRLGKPFRTVARVGEAAEAIDQVAADEGVDLIVMGTHGHGVLGRLLFGSSSRAVVTHAPCNVLVVR